MKWLVLPQYVQAFDLARSLQLEALCPQSRNLEQCTSFLTGFGPLSSPLEPPSSSL